MARNVELGLEYEQENLTENEKIKTQTPKELLPLKDRKKKLAASIAGNTVEQLKLMYKLNFGRNPPVKTKAQFIDETSDLLTFSTEEEFRQWFFKFSPMIQRILYLAAFTDYVPIPFLEKEFHINMIIRNSKYSWDRELIFDPELHLDFFPLTFYYNGPVTFIPEYLKEILILWLEPPALFQLSACRVSEPPDNTALWDNSPTIADTFPLLCDILQNMLKDMNEVDLGKNLKNGFKKRELNELRASTGFLPFNPENEHAPDSVDLAARFILCMYNNKPRRPADGQECVRNIAQAFFKKEPLSAKNYYTMNRAYLEYAICIDHLNRSPNTYFDDYEQLPAARKVFHDILLYIAKDGSWFDADKLAEHIRITGKDFSLFDSYLEHSLRIRADSFIFDGLTYSNDGYSEDFHLNGIMRFYLLVRPIFKAYCYIFATLGILEIVQGAPPLARSYREKQHPFSLYDSLKAVRITEFGRWCMGITDKKPVNPSHEYQAIADRELLLVTVQGNSLERRVYLDKIGQRLGEGRWRISPASFITGCANKRQITERIERFKALIDPKPAPHWERLFQKVLDYAGIFDENRRDILVYDLLENQELLEELLQDPELKRIARRVEGRMLAVAVKDTKKFYALLNEHGIAHF